MCVYTYILISKRSFIKTQRKEVTQSIRGGQYNQRHKLHKFIKSKIENKEKQPKEDIQSNRVLRMNILKSSKFLSRSSKLQAYLSLQIHHITQCRMAFQIIPFLWFPKHPCQAARRLKTDLGMTQYTPNSLNTIDHNSKANGQ